MRTRITPMVAAITVALAAPASLVIAVGSAHASVEVCSYKFNADGIDINSAAGGGTVNGQGQKGQPFTSDPAESSGIWIHGTDGDTGISGWVDEAYLTAEGCKTIT